MLLKYPGLTIAGGLALAIAIGTGAAWYDVSGKFLSPSIPLPDGGRLVSIDTRNTLTGEAEPRVTRDFLEWRRELRAIEGLGAYRTDTRNLVAGNAAPEPIRMAALTAAAFAAARVPPLLGRGLLESDEWPGAPGVVVIGYGVWQRAFGGRQDVVGSVVKLGNAPATVVGVMPDGFRYPLNYAMWTPLPLRATYAPLEGDAIGVIGRLAPGVTREQAEAELRVLAERASGALPATHRHLKPRVLHLGEESLAPDVAVLAMRNLPVLVVLLIACVSVGTLIYARTAIREGEIAVRTALGASRRRILGQLFVEALLLASIAAAAGLIGADAVATWVVGAFNQASGGVPFWITPGLAPSTILYAMGLAALTAAMLSVLPALKATHAGLLQAHLANRGAGGATLRFGRVWTGAMIVQVSLTAMAIPIALESASEAKRNADIRAAFPSRDYLAARIGVDIASGGDPARMFAELQRRIAQEPGVVAVTFADRVPGGRTLSRPAQVEPTAAATPFADTFNTSAVGPGFFETFDRPIVAGRAFHGGDFTPGTRTAIVNEAFARAFSRQAGGGSPIGARLRYDASSSFEIVGIVRDLGLDPDDLGHEQPFVFHASPAATVSPFVLNVRVRGNPAALAARLPVVAQEADAGLLVAESRPLEDWLEQRHGSLDSLVAAQAAVNGLALFLSAMSLFSLVSVSLSRRRREIGVRSALGASPRHLLGGVVSRALVIMGSGVAAGGVIVVSSLAMGAGPSGRPADDIPPFAVWLAVTASVMLATCLLACAGPARRALRINPAEALRDA
jgi:predicted permease